MAKHPPAKMSAVLGRCRRTGRWRLGARSNVLALLGSVRLDMRHSFVEGDEPDELKMKVMVLFGSAVLILPEGAEVRPSGMSFLSAEWVDVPEHPMPSGLPTLEVEWTCVLGRVHVVTGSVLERAARDKAAADAAADAEGEIEAGAGSDTPVDRQPWAEEPRADETPDPAPVAEIVVDMGMLDSEPWSMSDYDQPEPASEAEPDPVVDPGPGIEPEAAALEGEAQADAPEESAPQLVEAWRTHDWGPGITERDDEDEAATEAATEAEAEVEAEVAAPAVAQAEADAPEESAPQLVEAWRTHDWGPGIIDRDDEDEEEDDASAPAGASA